MNQSWKKSSCRSGAPQLEDVPELIHHIQSRLQVKDAARTSVLSKSWLHAWSTIPTLRFRHRPSLCKEEERNLALDMIDRTMIRYLRDNIPIESFDLVIEIDNQESASLAEKWIRLLAKTCVKKLSLTTFLYGASFNLPYEILSTENLTKMTVTSSRGRHSCLMTTSHHPVIINCVTLRELLLDGVQISQEILDGILLSCRLLAKIELSLCSKYLNTIKVKNLPCLYELTISTEDEDSTDLVISHLPNLLFFSCDLCVSWFKQKPPRPFKAHSISLGSSVTQLLLGGLITDYQALDMIRTGFPFLESLTLHMTSWMLKSFHFTCDSIKRLSLLLCHNSPLIDVQVHAPKLIFFRFGGDTLPSLLFPISTLKKIILWLNIRMPVDASFFIKMREVLMLSSLCDINITTENYSNLPLDIDIDDLRTNLPFPPARNVQRLSFKTVKDECLWERSLFFDAFFEICHPRQVFAAPDVPFKHNNHFCRLMLREVLEKKKKSGAVNWRQFLKHVQLKQPLHKQWKILTNSQRSFLDGSTPNVCMDFKLKWR